MAVLKNVMHIFEYYNIVQYSLVHIVFEISNILACVLMYPFEAQEISETPLIAYICPVTGPYDHEKICMFFKK